jgi:uncharacterized protein involved in exopolysaccharide biosynthesis
MQDNSNVNGGKPSATTTTSNVQGTAPESGEIDLVALLGKYVFPYWKQYCFSSFVTAVIFAALSYLVTPKFDATVQAQVQMGSVSGSSMLKAKLGGLGSMMGLSQMAGGDSEFLYNMNFITSREVADAFMEKYDLRHELFYDDYDEDGNYEKPKKLGKLYRKILGDDYQKDDDEDILLTPGPSKQTMYKAFGKVFTIEVNNKDMTASVSVRWENPLKAKQWANDYISFVNNILKTKAINESNLKIKYLESQIKERPEIEVQNSIYALVEDELKKISVAESSDQYAFKVIERAFLPEKKVFPNRYFFLFGGGFLGCFLVLAKRVYPDAIGVVCNELRLPGYAHLDRHK